MINWRYYPDLRPPIGEPIIVWYRGAVCPAVFERHNRAWQWEVVSYSEHDKHRDYTKFFLGEGAVSWWAEQNRPEE